MAETSQNVIPTPTNTTAAAAASFIPPTSVSVVRRENTAVSVSDSAVDSVVVDNQKEQTPATASSKGNESLMRVFCV